MTWSDDRIDAKGEAVASNFGRAGGGGGLESEETRRLVVACSRVGWKLGYPGAACN